MRSHFHSYPTMIWEDIIYVKVAILKISNQLFWQLAKSLHTSMHVTDRGYQICLYKEPQILFRRKSREIVTWKWLLPHFVFIFFFIFRSEIRLMTQQHAISKEGVTYQELQEMKNKLMALLENNATIYNLVQKYPFGMNWFWILFPTIFQMHYSCLKILFFTDLSTDLSTFL